MISRTKKTIAVAIASVGVIGVLGTAISMNKKNYDQRINATETTQYMRVWISYDVNALIGSNEKPGLWFHTGSGVDNDTKGTDTYITGHNNTGYQEWKNNSESNRPYYYFDVPTTVIGSYITIQTFTSDWTFAEQTTQSLQFTQEIAEKQQVFFRYEDKTKLGQGTVGSGTGSVDAGMAAKALEGLVTCNASTLYGYGAFANIKSTFVKNADVWKTSGNLGDFDISDYTSVTDYGDLTKRTATVDAYEKYEALAAKSGAGV